MTDRDREDLTSLATGGLSFWKARSLRRRITREPELAHEWEGIQSLYSQLRTMANVHPVPAVPAWSPSQERRPMPISPIAIGIAAVALSALVLSWVVHNLNTPRENNTEFAPEHTRALSILYDVHSPPEPILLDPRRRSRTVEATGMVGELYPRTDMAWKVFGNVQVKVTYFDGTSKTLTSRYTEDKAKLKRLKEAGAPFSSKDTTPIIRWSRGVRVQHKLIRPRPLKIDSDGSVTQIDTWSRRVADGKMKGYGIHQIKDGQGKILAALVVEKLPVQLRHDPATSHRRAEK